MTRPEQIRNLLHAMEMYCRGKILLAVESRGGKLDLDNGEDHFYCFDPLGDLGDSLMVKSIEGNILKGTILAADETERPGEMELELLDAMATFELYQTLFEDEGFSDMFDRNDVVISFSLPEFAPTMDTGWLPVLVDGRNILLIHPMP